MVALCPDILFAFVTESYTFFNRKGEEIPFKKGITENGIEDTNTSKKEV